VDSSDSKNQSLDVIGSQHVLVCALHELGSLVLRLGTSASPLVSEPATGIYSENEERVKSHSQLHEYFHFSLIDAILYEMDQDNETLLYLVTITLL